MFFLLRLFLISVGIFFFLTLVTGVSVATRLRRHLRDPFINAGKPQMPPPPPGKGDIIEGEFTVLDEKSK